MAVVLSLLVGIGGCYFAYLQHKAAHLQMQKVMKDLTSLQSAEDALTQVQNELVHDIFIYLCHFIYVIFISFILVCIIR